MSIVFKDVVLNPILNIENLVINKGECVCLTGDNGSGKTTLCKLLASLYYPDSGSILIDGVDIKKYKTCQVAMTMQNPKTQVLKSTVCNDVAFGLENKNLDVKIMDEKIDRSLSYFNLSDLKHSETSLLSGGQLQRVLFSSIDALDSQIFIFDEPLAMIDIENREIFYSYLETLKKRNKTIIIVSHILTESLPCQRLITLDKGKIISDTKYKAKEIVLNKVSQNNNFENKKTILEINNLTFSYTKQKTILQDLNLIVKESEIVGILGTTGSGKTTLLNLIIGIIKNKKIKHNNTISFALQNPQDQISCVKVLDEVSYNLFQKTNDKKLSDKRSKEILEKLNKDLLDKDVYSISQGQLRLVTIASALNSDSDLILLDEITAHLDHKTINNVFALLKELNKAVILVSHDRQILLSRCDTVYSLEDKKLVRVK